MRYGSGRGDGWINRVIFALRAFVPVFGPGLFNDGFMAALNNRQYMTYGRENSQRVNGWLGQVG
ncbi:hypothetical protein OI70_19640 [Dickeya fangzhongdai]|nr:hypothetical protein LH89_01970 [Dickeya fangzhongdai]KGT96598.1 hypothetical protein NM75_19205 [Dickeya fangzhongdai]KHN52557.1 hypothetical protein OI70_19640 [Dickeya fangzhongdai]